MRYAILIFPLIALLAFACDDDEGGGAPTGTPATPTAATPEVERPNPETLVPAGAGLDQALEVSLDGSAAGQLVVISHIARIGGTPAPDECPDNSVLSGDPSPCAFRVEIFSQDGAGGWSSRYLEDDASGEKPGSGTTQAVEARSFRLDADGRVALVLTRVSCYASNCPVEAHQVLTMKDGEIVKVYEASEALLELGPSSATFSSPAYAEFSGGCCPNGRLVQTVGLDAASGEVKALDADLKLCTEGPFVMMPEPANRVSLRCNEDSPTTGYLLSEATAFEPAEVGGLSGIQDGDRIRVEYTVKECPDSLLDCEPGSITPLATKVTVLAE